jgi:hypothetical protein
MRERKEWRCNRNKERKNHDGREQREMSEDGLGTQRKEWRRTGN